MRRLLPTAKSFLIHSGQTGALLAIGVLAMAAAPSATRTAVAAEAPQAHSAPIAPPIKAEVEPAGPVTRKLAFDMPVKGYAINSRFGLRRLASESKARAHNGIDIAAPKGTAVFAAAEGRVLRSGYQAGGYGNFIELRHPNGMTTIYAHLSRIDVASGQEVAHGQRIGLVGSTGFSTGPHLHFEVKRNGGQVNPERVLGRSFDLVIKSPQG